jgi:copper chaperone
MADAETKQAPPAAVDADVKPAAVDAGADVDAAPAAAADLNKYEFKINMSCGGCSGAVTRVLTKLQADGVDKFEVSLADQNAIVYADKKLPYKTVLAKIQNTGKKVTAGFENDEERSVEKEEAAPAAA